MNRTGLLALLLAAVASTAQTQSVRTSDCPPGTVRGGLRCEIKELCPNGQPPHPLSGCRPPVSTRYDPDPAPVPTRPAARLPDRHPCEETVQFYREASPSSGSDRTLLLVNGRLQDMFEDYLKELDRSALKIDYKTLTIHYMEGSESKRLREGEGIKQFSFSDVFFMTPRKKLWIDAMSGKFADRISHEEIDLRADQLRADVLCGR